MNIYVNIQNDARGKSFITDNIKKRLDTIGNVKYNNETYPLSGESFREAAKGCEVIITGWGQPCLYTPELAGAKLIVHTGGTVGGIVDLSVFDAGVTVISGNDMYAESVAEGVLSYILSALRNLRDHENDLRNGKWKWDVKTEGLIGRSVGIISLGNVSKKLIPLLKLFTDDIKVYSTHPSEKTAAEYGFEYASLDDIFTSCDIVSVHTAKNDETYHMINKRHFDMLKDGALFVNTSRGAVIDEAALAKALKENRFSAVLDVYEKEPLPSDSPLLKLQNVFLFPHMAGPTFDRRERITNALIDDIIRFKTGGQLKNIITKETAAKMTIS